MLCPSDTPEGEQCGLTKNLAMMTHITVEVPEADVINTLYSLGLEDINTLTGLEIRQDDRYLVYLNGTPLGSIYNHVSLINSVRKLRRKGYLNQFVSVSPSQIQKAVNISCDGGRLCRPYLIVGPDGKLLLTEDHMKKIKSKTLEFEDLVGMGIIEYLDVNEENDGLISVLEKDIIVGETTHLEIEPFTLLGICASLIPYPHHNQSPRNTYQCAMGRQAMGTIAYNQRIRMDTLLYNLVYPQRPILKSRPLEMVNFEKVPAGQNACIAVMSYSGFDIEDALILNSTSLDRGFGRCIVYRATKTSLKRYLNGSSDIIKGREVTQEEDGSLKPVFKHQALGPDGVADTGAKLVMGQHLVNKYSPANQTTATSANEYQPQPLKWPHTYKETHYVESVEITQRPVDNTRLYKCLIRQTRRPEVGDKFSSRHGQKGVTGLIVKQQDMPFSSTGICPDVIMNPHGYPSRMTVGKLLELIGSKAGALRGGFHYGTAFGERHGTACDVKTLRQILVDHHFNYQGKDHLTSGITGESLEAYIYSGPVSKGSEIL